MTEFTYTADIAKGLIIAGNAPADMVVKGSLNPYGTKITTLPDNLTVGGWLNIECTRITTLPDNLTVGGSLNLYGTKITALPDNLTVGGWLHLGGTKLTALPTPWFTQCGKTTRRRRCIAVSYYALIQTETDRFYAGCRENFTRSQALKHWGPPRTDARAVAFRAAIEANPL